MTPIHQYRLETIFLTESKGHNSDNNWWILSLIKLDLYLCLYTCVWNMNPIQQCIQKISPGNHFSYKIKGYNSDNNEWVLSLNELDLYFTIIYLCMKYESNTPMFSKDIAWKPIFLRRSRAITLTIISVFKQCWPVFYDHIPVFEIWIQ